jgi:hypothetical protein
MTYPPTGQPGGWPDQSWPSPDPYQDPAAQASPAGYQQSYPAAPYSAPGYQQPGYQQPGYPPQPFPVYAQPQSTNGLAIASLVCAILGLFTCGLSSIVGAILGHVARKQIAERNEGGDGVALSGIIVGWIVTVLYAGLLVFYAIAIGLAVKNGNDYSSDYTDALVWLFR